MTLTVFHNPRCAPCEALRHALGRWTPPKDLAVCFVDGTTQLDQAIDHSVWQFPTIILTDQQREIWRYIGFISVYRLEQELKNFLKQWV
jgi:glutaredoxin